MYDFLNNGYNIHNIMKKGGATNLKKELRAKIKKLISFNTKNREQLLKEIESERKILLKNNIYPYFCSKCKKNHRSGKIYLKHKIHAVDDIKFPKIPALRVKDYRIKKIFEKKSSPEAFSSSNSSDIEIIRVRKDLGKVKIKISTGIRTLDFGSIKSEDLFYNLKYDIPVKKHFKEKRRGKYSTERYDYWKDDFFGSPMRESLGRIVIEYNPFLSIVRWFIEILQFGYPMEKLKEYIEKLKEPLKENFLRFRKIDEIPENRVLDNLLLNFKEKSPIITLNERRYALTDRINELKNDLGDLNLSEPLDDFSLKIIEEIIDSTIKMFELRYQDHPKLLNDEKFRKDISFKMLVKNLPKVILPKCNLIYHLEILGVYYADSGDYLDDLPEGTELELIREPHNPYDSHAISVRHDGTHLGYISKEINRTIEPYLLRDDGSNIKCLFGRYSPSFSTRNSYSYESDNDFYPERGSITFHVSNNNKMLTIIKNLIKLHSLNYPIKSYDISPLGSNAYQICRWYCINHTSKSSSEFLSKVEYEMNKRIKTGKGSLSILL